LLGIAYVENGTKKWHQTSDSPMSRRNIHPRPIDSSAFAGIEIPMQVERFLDL